MLGAPAARAQPAPAQLDPQISQALIDLSFEFNYSRWRKVKRQLVRSELPVPLYFRSITALNRVWWNEEVRRGIEGVPDSVPWPLFQGRTIPDYKVIYHYRDRMMRPLSRVVRRHQRDDYYRLDKLLRQQQPPINKVQNLRICADSNGRVQEVRMIQPNAARLLRRPEFVRDDLYVPDTVVLALLHQQQFRLRGVYSSRFLPGGLPSENCLHNPTSALRKVLRLPITLAKDVVGNGVWRAWNQRKIKRIRKRHGLPAPNQRPAGPR